MRTYPRHPEHQLDIELGSTVQDRITGFMGIAMSRVEYLTGCTQYGVTARYDGSNGKLGETNYFDWQRLSVAKGPDELADLNTSKVTQRGDGAGEAPGARHDAPTR
jgi:hypothetical protein